jgi:predicted GNAT family N-acyltransferase
MPPPLAEHGTMDSPASPLITPQVLRAYCRQQRFEPGDVLRQKGQHYRHMYLLTEGTVDVDREAGGAAGSLLVSGVAPIGEIGFLRGWAATATVTARTPTAALVIDDAAFARLEQEHPTLSAAFLRDVATIAEARASDNLVFTSTLRGYSRSAAIDTYLCRTPDMVETAQRLRYEVYVEELGRQSPYADHGRKIITDDLDATGHIFIAVEAGQTVGTLRANAASDGSLGVLEELYGMKTSRQHPAHTAACTKFIVKKSKRGGSTSLKLIAALARYGVRLDIRECYIDCIPALLPYYRALGFRLAGPQFLHRENGPSHPMMLDLVKHGGRLSREPGLRSYVGLIARAHAIKWVDRLRELRRPSTLKTP